MDYFSVVDNATMRMGRIFLFFFFLVLSGLQDVGCPGVHLCSLLEAARIFLFIFIYFFPHAAAKLKQNFHLVVFTSAAGTTPGPECVSFVAAECSRGSDAHIHTLSPTWELLTFISVTAFY